MAFQNEEDYLDNLLKSMSDSGSKSAGSDLLSTASEMTVPETFIDNVQGESVLDDSVYEQMLFNLEHGIQDNEPVIDNDEINPMAAMFENSTAQSWEDYTVGQVVDSTKEHIPYSDTAALYSQQNIDNIVSDEPVIDEPIPEEPVVEEIIADEPVFEEPVSDEPVVEEIIADEPVIDETMTDEPVIEEMIAYEPVIDEPVSYEPVIEKMIAYEPVPDEPVIEENVAHEAEAVNQDIDEADVDAYIQRVLQNDEAVTEVPQDVVSEEITPEEAFVEENPVEYIDMTDSELTSENDLLGMIDGIINDVESELLESEAAEQQSAATSETEQDTEDKIDFSDLQVDEELKELLGMEDGAVQDDSIQESEQFSEEELLKLENIEAEAEEIENASEESLPVIPDEDIEDDSLAGLKSMLSEVGLSADEAGVMEEEQQEEEQPQEQQLFEIADIADMQDVNSGKNSEKTGKPGLIEKILGFFGKNKKNKAAKEAADENEQVLNELFDENGELLGEKNKAKKKGLFSKSSKKKASENGIVETPINDFTDDDDEDEIEIKDKPKKEKKKKEPKPKKEKKKKQPKPKVKKEKAPVNPADLVQVKPVVWLVMIIITAGITGYIYFAVSSFAYNQAMDTATYYMVGKKYNFAYDAISGTVTKSEEDTALKEQIMTIMYVQNHYNSYERYVKMNMMFNAIDSLVQGIAEYDYQYEKAVQIGVGTDLDAVKKQITDALMQYGITENMAREYAKIADYQQYAYIIESYGGISYDRNN